MITLTLFGAGWLACSAASYLIMRHAFRRSWTWGDVMTYGVMCLIGWPAVLLGAGLGQLVVRISDRPAKW